MLQDRPGSVIGGALLIAGSCIGAGMLGLPILTGFAGFFPSLLLFIAAWIFMLFTGFLMVEVNGWFKNDVNIVSMADHSLGRFGRGLSWILYLFLFYSLLIAYVSGSGNLFSSFFQMGLSIKLPIWVGSIFFVILFGWIVYLGTRPVDLWNRVLMVGKIVTYIALVMLGIKYVSHEMLEHTDLRYALYPLPILVISFGYHNMIPTLVSYMKGDLLRVRKAIFIGTTFALVIYLLWEIIVLGIVPLQGEYGIISSYKNDQEASQALSGILGSSWLSTFAQGLAFFAILTSFLAQALSLVHFLADGFKLKKGPKENKWLCVLALAPPLILSMIYPQLFFKALNFAGGFCAVILFGLLPVCMVWIGRYRKQMIAEYQVPGKRLMLGAILFFSLFILIFQIATMSGASFIPKP